MKLGPGNLFFIFGNSGQVNFFLVRIGKFFYCWKLKPVKLVCQILWKSLEKKNCEKDSLNNRHIVGDLRDELTQVGKEMVAVKIFPLQDKQSWFAEQEIYNLPQVVVAFLAV